MNPKIANLIAIEIGILIGLMSWLTYSRFPSTEPGTEARMQESAATPVTTVAPAFEASNQRPSTVDYSAEREQARLMAERSASLASLQRYYQAIATEPYTRSGLDNSSIAVDTPSYTAAEQPAEDLAPPQTVIYYAQPIQTVVFSNPRRSRDRCRSVPDPGTNRTITHQCPSRENPHQIDTRVVSFPKTDASSPLPPQGVNPRGNVRQTGVTGSQQKRVAGPGSPGAARRSLSVP